MWIGRESENITVANNTVRGGNIKNDSVRNSESAPGICPFWKLIFLWILESRSLPA
jgi:hypothetical protein